MGGIDNMAERDRERGGHKKRERESRNALTEWDGEGGQVTVNHCKWRRENRLHEKWIRKREKRGEGCMCVCERESCRRV